MPRKPAVAISFWNHLFECLQASPRVLHASPERAPAPRQIPHARRSRAQPPVGDDFPARREHPRVRGKNLAFDLRAIPFGTGFFVSWWPAKLRAWLPFALPILLIAVTGVALQFLHTRVNN